MRNAIAMLLSALAVSAAVAQPGDRNSIDIKVRLRGSETWLDEVDAEPGTVVEVASFYFRDRGYSFAQAVHNIIAINWDAAAGDTAEIVDNPSSTLHPDGRVGRGGIAGGFNFGGQRQDIYTTGIDTSRMRISAFGNPNNVVAGGIAVSQNTPVAQTQHYTEDGILGYRFNITVGAGAGRTIPVNAPLEGINSFSIYATSSSTSTTNILSFYDGSDGAVIHVVPAPFSTAVFAVAVAGAARRRRNA